MKVLIVSLDINGGSYRALFKGDKIMTKKKSTQKLQTETIIITPGYFDLMASEEVQAFRKDRKSVV